MVSTRKMDLKKLSSLVAFLWQRYNLLPIEKIMLFYCSFTFLLAIVFWNEIAPEAIFNRIYILGVTFFLVIMHRIFPGKVGYYLRMFYQLLLLGYWYPDIYYFARFMPNTDHFFALCDQVLFGFQPAIMFRRWLDGFMWRELFNMGYFSYYIMIFAVVVWAAVKCKERFEKISCVVLTSFMLYYVVFLFLQSAGPQFYFECIGMDNVEAGVFPLVGDWFKCHSELVHHQVGEGGWFTSLVECAQKSEKPIAAFPSSHVGLSTILIVLAWTMSRKLFAVLFPFYCVLCLSTVYIGAHYAIDVLGGWLSAIVVLLISQKVSQMLLNNKVAH